MYDQFEDDVASLLVVSLVGTDLKLISDLSATIRLFVANPKFFYLFMF